MRIGKRVRHLFQRRRFEAELAEEVRIHREMAETQLRENGASEEEARNAARRQFGSEALVLDESRDVWRFVWVEGLLQDVNYAARGWARNPGFAAIVIATIGLALGLNTALFTAFDHYVLRPLAVRDPGSLYQVEWSTKSGAGHFFTWEEFQRLREQKDVLSGTYAAFGVLGQIDQQPAWGQLVTPDFFEMLGARVAIGRPFTPEDAPAPGAGAYIVLGHNCWKSKYGSDPDIIGRRVFVRGQSFEVIGVAAPEFTGIGPVPADFWVPLTMYAALNNGTNIFAPSKIGLLLAVVRLRPDVSLEAAKAGLLWLEPRADERLSRGSEGGGDSSGVTGECRAPESRRHLVVCAHFCGIRAGTVNGVRERVEHDAGEGSDAAARDWDPALTWGGEGAADPAASDRGFAAVAAGRTRRVDDFRS